MFNIVTGSTMGGGGILVLSMLVFSAVGNKDCVD